MVVRIPPNTTMTRFQEILADALLSIPPGRVSSFREIASALGDPRAALAVRNECLRLSRIAPEVPWWRAVSSDGRPLPGALDRIREEGGLEDLREGRFYRGVRAWPVFELMARAQRNMASMLRLEPLTGVEVAAGVDVSYGGEEAVASCVTVDSGFRVLQEVHERFIPQIPYVPTYLAFRELRGMLPSAMRCDFDVIFVDGHGLAHPRLMGEASHLGLLLRRPSIGVAKSRLVGRIGEGGVILLQGREVGALVGRGFVSPGHMTDLESSVRIARKFWREGKQPLPLLLAHRYSRRVIRES